MRFLLFLAFISIFSTCYRRPYPVSNKKEWGSKPVYGIDTILKKISWSATPAILKDAGNIYVKGNYLYQVETGNGIHVINNSNPATAARIGFITINGCSQISIKGNILYSNNYDDMVMIDISNINAIKEVARTKMAFPTGRQYYPFSSPKEAGYYQCPRTDSLVVGWVKDSVLPYCYKN